MYCDACNAQTSLRFNVDTRSRRMSVCHACYLIHNAGVALRPAHAHNHDHVERRRRSGPVFGSGREVPESFR